MSSPIGDVGSERVNRIYNHIVEGTREFHLSVHDLQSTTRLVESWMLQIIDTRMGFDCTFHNVVIDYFSPTSFIYDKKPNFNVVLVLQSTTP